MGESPRVKIVAKSQCAARAEKNAADYRRYLEALPDGMLNSAINYRTSKGEAFSNSVGDTLTHVSLHGAYHRGQPDIYRRDSDMVAYVIAYAKLPDEMLPEEMQVFTNALRRQRLFLSCLKNKEKAPITKTIFDLFESEVKNIMLDLEEENWRRLFALVAGQKEIERKIVSALGEDRIISLLGKKKIVSALGEEKIFSALGDEKVVDALLKNRRLLNLLLAKLDGKQRRKLPVKKAAIARNVRRLNPA